VDLSPRGAPSTIQCPWACADRPLQPPSPHLALQHPHSAGAAGAAGALQNTQLLGVSSRLGEGAWPAGGTPRPLPPAVMG